MKPVFKLTFCAAVLGTAFTAQAAEVTLTFADWQIPSASTTQEGAGVFMDKVRELSDGEIDFKYYPAEQLGKGGEMLRLAQTGVADIVHISPAYITDRFPLTTVAELPGMPLDVCKLTSAIYEMAQPGGSLYEAEFEPNGVRLLFSGNLGPYSLLTSKVAVDSLDKLSGLNIRTAGGPMEMTATELGANAIRMTGSETLPSLSRGTLDGLLWPIPLVKDWSLEDALNHMTPNVSTGSFVVTYSISENSWNKLSPEHQEILLEAGKFASENYCDFVNKTWEEAKNDLIDNHDIQSTDLTADEVEKANERFESVHQKWLSGLQGKGASQAVYEEFIERSGS